MTHQISHADFSGPNPTAPAPDLGPILAPPEEGMVEGLMWCYACERDDTEPHEDWCEHAA